MFDESAEIRYIIACILTNILFHPQILLSHDFRNFNNVRAEIQAYLPKFYRIYTFARYYTKSIESPNDDEIDVGRLEQNSGISSNQTR